MTNPYLWSSGTSIIDTSIWGRQAPSYPSDKYVLTVTAFVGIFLNAFIQNQLKSYNKYKHIMLNDFTRAGKSIYMDIQIYTLVFFRGSRSPTAYVYVYTSKHENVHTSFFHILTFSPIK